MCHFVIKINKKWTKLLKSKWIFTSASDGLIEMQMKSQMCRLGYWPLTTKNPSHQLQLIDQPVTHAGRSLILSSSNSLSVGYLLYVNGFLNSSPLSHHFDALWILSISLHNVKLPYLYPVIYQTHPRTQPTAPLTHAPFSLVPLVSSPEAATNQCQVDMPTCQWQPLCRWQTGWRKRRSRCRREGSIVKKRRSYNIKKKTRRWPYVHIPF